MKANHLSRRLLLQLAAAGATSAMLPSLLTRKAQAGSPVSPTRILFVYNMGTVRDFYMPLATAGNSAPTETSFDLGPIHGALAPYKQDLILTRGISMMSEKLDPIGGANAHVQGGTHALTAINRMTSSLSSGISIDQLIAQTINTPTPVTRYASWELDFTNAPDPEGGTSYIAPGQINSRQYSASATVKQFPANIGGESAAQQQAAADLLARQKASLDFALSEYGSVKARLSQADKAKLDQHAQAIRDLEAQLQIGSSAACTPPDSTLTSLASTVDKHPSGPPPADWVQSAWQAQAQLTVSALSCDLTRVGILHMPGYGAIDSIIDYAPATYNVNGKTLSHTDTHDLAHQCSGTYVNGSSGDLWSVPQAVDLIQKFDTAQANMFAQLLGYLKAVPNADGGTLLDSTVVLYCGQIANGYHETDDLPWILAGSANGYFRTGRFLQFPTGTAHNDLYVSLANAMGVPITTFGNPAASKGALANLR